MTAGQAPASTAAPPPAPVVEVQQRAFEFFWHETNAKTGLTQDRARNIGKPGGSGVASIAATGYMLASLPIGVEHHWISQREAYSRALVALRFIHDRFPQEHGFYYHFVDPETGERVWNCEVSSIDTALLVLGTLADGEYWQNSEVHRLAEKIASRVDWQWMTTEDGKTPHELAPAMGWTPETGWTSLRWRGYNEAAFLYWLAMGTPEHGLPAAAWDAWQFETADVAGYPVFGGPAPLFMAQMAPGFFDLRGQLDRQGRDWWQAWTNAHLADQAFCAGHPGNKTYHAGFWGIDASDQAEGYGVELPQDGRNTGTVSPTAMVAAGLFTPERSAEAMAGLWSFRDRIWGRYGYSEAMNLEKNWFDPDVVGIDLGMMLMATENARSGLIWRLMNHSPFVRRGLAAAGFHKKARE